MSIAVDGIKYGALLAGSELVKKNLESNSSSPSFTESLTAGWLTGLALGSHPKYISIPYIFPLRPALKATPNALVPRDLITPKPGTAICNALQSVVFCSVYDQIKKRLEEGNGTLTPQLKAIVGMGAGAGAGATLTTLRYPVEIYHAIQSERPPKGLLSSFEAYKKLFKSMPKSLLCEGLAQSLKRPVIAAATAGAIIETAKAAFSKKKSA